MMVANVKKILISIKDNNIIFSYKTNNSNINKDLINTNIISDNELIFSDENIEETLKKYKSASDSSFMLAKLFKDEIKNFPKNVNEKDF